jgi:hypothetical protein
MAIHLHARWARRVLFASGLVVGAGIAAALVLMPLASEAGAPQYQRRAAAQVACKAAGAEISALRLKRLFEFVDDCSSPKVTTVLNQQGYVIVTRVVEENIGQSKRRKSYSALMDGRGADAWRMLHIQLAPSVVTLEFSPNAIASLPASNTRLHER